MPKTNISITAFGEDRPGILVELMELLAQEQATIADSRLMMVRETSIRDRFMLMIVASLSATKLQLETLEKNLNSKGLEKGFNARLDVITSIKPQVSKIKVIIVAHGKGRRCLAQGKTTNCMAEILRRIMLQGGNVDDMDLKVVDEINKEEFFLTFAVSIPIDGLHLEDLSQPLDSEIRITVRHVEVFGFMQRIDAELR